MHFPSTHIFPPGHRILAHASTLQGMHFPFSHVNPGAQSVKAQGSMAICVLTVRRRIPRMSRKAL